MSPSVTKCLIFLVSFLLSSCLGKASNRDDHLSVKRLTGRPWHVLNMKDVPLSKLVFDDKSKSSTRSSSLSLYVVRVSEPRAVVASLRSIAAGKYMQYYPHDTYLMALDAAQAEAVTSLRGVEGVFAMPAEAKTASRAAQVRAAAGDTVTLDVQVAVTNETRGTFASTLMSWQQDLRKVVPPSSFTMRWASTSKVVVVVDVAQEDAVWAWLAEQPLVVSIEERPTFIINNKYAVSAAASSLLLLTCPPSPWPCSRMMERKTSSGARACWAPARSSGVRTLGWTTTAVSSRTPTSR